MKIDGLMRQADALPEGAIKQQRKAQLQESTQQVSRQLSRIENNKTNREWRRSKNAGALYSADKRTYTR